MKLKFKTAGAENNLRLPELLHFRFIVAQEMDRQLTDNKQKKKQRKG